MPLFGRSLGEYLGFVRVGIVLLVLMGVVRFAVGASGVPYEKATHLTSMTILAWMLALVYGHRARAAGFGGYRHLLPAAFLLAAAMYGFIILAILVEGLAGIHGYFHSPGAGLAPPGMGVGRHVVGQLIAMLAGTVVLWGLASLGFLLSSYLRFLRKAFLLLAAMALLRGLVGAAGVPYAVGTWPTSLTLLAMGLAFYYGYRGPARGFDGYRHMIVVGVILGAFLSLLIAYGILVTDGLEVRSYFHAPGEGFQPPGISLRHHVLAHLEVTPFAGVLLALLASAGLAVGRRTSLAPANQAT